MTFVFDRPEYCGSLGWLGRPVHGPAGSVILRSAPLGTCDARGSWPYQSPPSPELIETLHDMGSPITLTCVISPDTSATTARALSDDTRIEVRQLKDHLCHRAKGPAAWNSYSTRTRRRISLAREKLVVTREDFCPSPEIIAGWQDTLRRHRRIARSSSPDLAHFRALRDMALASRDIACLTLRWRKNAAACGVLIAGFDPFQEAWHAHSALADADARKAFGMYLLFDDAIRRFPRSDFWLGGAPGGANGSGVFRFKQRFANFTAPAHILSVELDPITVQRVRKHTGIFPYLPDYRDPAIEMRHDPDGRI